MGHEEREQRRQLRLHRVKKRKRLAVIISVVLVLGLFQYAYAELRLGYSESDRRTARDLAVLSGLTEDQVFDLYDARESWDQVTENIFVYKKILDCLPQGWWSGRETFDHIRDHQAGDILAVCEFLTSYGQDYSPAGDYLRQHSEGRSLEEIFASVVTSRDYAAYQPVGRDQIRQWLAAGHLPQDIINADSIAMAKDLEINGVLAMKTDSTEWEAIGRSLGYEFKSEESAVALNLPGADGAVTVSASDYESLVKDANDRAEENRAKTEEELRTELGLTGGQMEEYKAQGFNLYDIQNAQRLSRETGAAVEQILQRRREGQAWDRIAADTGRDREESR